MNTKQVSNAAMHDLCSREEMLLSFGDEPAAIAEARLEYIDIVYDWHVRNGLTISESAREWGIPRSTAGRYVKRGRERAAAQWWCEQFRKFQSDRRRANC